MYKLDSGFQCIPTFKWIFDVKGFVPFKFACGNVYISEILAKYKNIIFNYSGYSDKTSKHALDETFIEIRDNVYLYLSNVCRFEKAGACYILYKAGEDITEITDFIYAQRIIEDKDEAKLSLIYEAMGGLDRHSFVISAPEIDFDINYNSGFEEISDIVVSRLKVQNDKGVVLFHGKPGTGKTTYLRWLINQKIGKTFLYLPAELSHQIASPRFIPFLINNPNSILIIEDAENVLMSRSGGRNDSVANLLNLTDGLLSDCLNIQIVATFNTDLRNIDSALLRKGRLIAKYEFNDLSSDRVEKLSKKLGVSLANSMVLSDIYNSTDRSFVPKKVKIGFNSIDEKLDLIQK